MTIPKGLSARAVIELDDGRSFCIDIRDNSMFVQFYTVYMVRGKGRKRPTERASFRNRNFASSIEEAVKKFEKHFNTYGKAKVKSTTIKIYRKRLYNKRYKMRPDELGLARVYNDLSGYLRKHQKLPATFIRKEEAALV
jgi:hypothetical protein